MRASSTGIDDFETVVRRPGDEPYPEMMNRGAVAEIAAIDPDLVVVKGDLTAIGDHERVRPLPRGVRRAFGDRLLHVRGNHESYHGQTRRRGAVPGSGRPPA